MKGMEDDWKNDVREEKEKRESMQKEIERLQEELLVEKLRRMEVEKRLRDKLEILETMMEGIEGQENRKGESQVEIPPKEEEEKSDQGEMTVTKVEDKKSHGKEETDKHDMVLIVGDPNVSRCRAAIDHRVQGDERIQVVPMLGKGGTPVME